MSERIWNLWLCVCIFSAKFAAKMHYIRSLEELHRRIPTEYIYIPDEIKQYVSGYLYRVLPTSMFCVELTQTAGFHLWCFFQCTFSPRTEVKVTLFCNSLEMTQKLK